jgi:biotin carboxylase
LDSAASQSELSLVPGHELRAFERPSMRVLLLLPTTTYRAAAFIEAAEKMGVDVVVASEQPSTMAAGNPAGLVTLSFAHPELAGRQAAEFARRHPVDAVIPVDDETAVVAASVARAIGIPHNSPEAALTAKNKYLMREALRRAGMRVPRYLQFTLDDDIAPQLSEVARRLAYPVVVKPLFLSTSRGVMRANNDAELIAATGRLESILSQPSVARRGGTLGRQVLVEEFIPGVEVALEGLLTGGKLQVLAIFDKPDPLDGPFFEETIYVTPSRLSSREQDRIAEETEAAARAMGLTIGPVHAELRLNEAGPWVVEVAARAIGGLCSRALRFDGGLSLEQVILRHALGHETAAIRREKLAAGVMMIPIPRAGILEQVRGADEAGAVAGIEDVVVTAHITQKVAPPPEGSSYLGFIFARAGTAAAAEAALREAHAKLEFVIV